MTIIAQEMWGIKLSTPENNSTTILGRIGYNTCINGKSAKMTELQGSSCNTKLKQKEMAEYDHQSEANLLQWISRVQG